MLADVCFRIIDLTGQRGGNTDKLSDRLIKEKTQFNFISSSHPSIWVKADILMINTICWINERAFAFCLHRINYTSEVWTGYINISVAAALWRSAKWFGILALFAHTKHAVSLRRFFNLADSAPNMTGAARNPTFPQIEWSLSGQMWACNRKTCPISPCTHESHLFTLWTVPYF